MADLRVLEKEQNKLFRLCNLFFISAPPIFTVMFPVTIKTQVTFPAEWGC